MRTIALACACLLTVTSVSGAQATQPAPVQSQLPLVSGMRVRVTASNLVAPLVANYLESSADTLKFVEGRGIWSLTLDQITKLEVTIGEQRHNRSYVIKYGAIGAAAGALAFGYYSANFRPGDRSKDYSMLGTAAIGAVVGGGIGAYIGSRASAEKWRALPLPKKISLFPDAAGRWHLGGSLSF